MRKAGRIMVVGLSIVLACALALVGALLLMSPGKPRPFLDESGRPLAGSISEKVFIDVNGVREGMFIKGKDKTKPVLLYLHGGMPDYFLTPKYPTGFEDEFVVCWWEQRGSGISYAPDIPTATLNVEQLVSDTLVVTDYLRRRFGTEKIYLMGHSGGTFIGIQAAARAPEKYHAYIGVAQMADQLESERLAYEYMLARFKENGDSRMVRRLEASPVTREGGTPAAYRALRDPAMHSLGVGTTHDMKSVVTGIFLPSLVFPEYTLSEKLHLWLGKSRSGVSCVWDEMLARDLSERLPEIGLPVYFMEGVYDRTCTYEVAKAYFGKLKAPVKGFYTFEASAHSPMFEEPEKMRRILRVDVLAGTNSLADAR